jgi:phage terminase Nu1 subunit (DNA packaging protein)
MHEFTVNKIAEMLERDRASMARVLRSIPADAGTPKKPLYRLATAVRALIAYEVEPDGRRGNGDTVRLAAERARLAREQADQVALKNAIMRRENVPLRMIERGATIIFSTFRERCLAIPGKIAAFCEMRSRDEVEKIVRDEIYEALEELSRPILTIDGPWAGDEPASDVGEKGVSDD